MKEVAWGAQMISTHKGVSDSNQSEYSQLSPHSQPALARLGFHDFHPVLN